MGKHCKRMRPESPTSSSSEESDSPLNSEDDEELMAVVTTIIKNLEMPPPISPDEIAELNSSQICGQDVSGTGRSCRNEFGNIDIDYEDMQRETNEFATIDTSNGESINQVYNQPSKRVRFFFCFSSYMIYMNFHDKCKKEGVG
jgi:hypothetical protein